MTLRSITLLFLLYSTVMVGQVSIGHRAGVSFSRWVWTGANAAKRNDEQAFVMGASAEIPVEITVHGHARISTGIAFIQKGFQYKGELAEQYRCNYVQVPLNLGWAFDVRRFQVTPSIGGAFGMNVRGVEKINNNGIFQTAVYPIGRFNDLGYYLRMPDQEWSLLGRLSVAYQWDHSAIALDLSYQRGLSNVMFDVDFVDQNGSPVPPYEATQRTFAIQLGYRLTLGSGRIAPMPEALPTDSLGNAQPLPRSEPRIMIGQRFGITSSTMDFTASNAELQTRVNEGAGPGIGITAAAVVRIRLTKHLGLQPELAYMQKGWESRWFSRPSLMNDLIRMNYVELPLLVNYHFGARRFRPYVLVGPVLGRGVGGVQVYHARGSFDFYGANSITFNNNELGNDKGFSRWDLSAIGALGLSFRMGHSELNIDVRYQHSFTDLSVEPNFTFIEASKVEAYHRNWMVNVGYLVPWRK